MSVEDVNRRIYGSRPVGRVLSGQDQFEKEALDGPAEGHLAVVRRARQSGTPVPGPEHPNSFAAALKRWSEEKKKKK